MKFWMSPVAVVLCVEVSCLGILAGCKPPALPSAPTQQAGGKESAHTGHEHAAHGPHGGELVELGAETYHAELLHDAHQVTIYILDGSARNSVAIDARELTVNLKHDGKPEQFKLPARPESTDPAGKSSRFELRSDDLARHVDDPAADARLVVMIEGTAYRGSLAHDHDHAHDQDHGHSHDPAASHEHEHEPAAGKK
jgi:hypothetical protein